MMQVFREMKNHYDKHTYTDIGTQLLNTYESYFLDYERDHPQDLNVAACPRCGRAPPRRPPETGRLGVAKEPKEATSALGETAAKDERPGAFKREDGVTKEEAPAKPPAPAVSSGCAVSPFGGVAWAREGVADADLRAAAEGSRSEPLNGEEAKEPSARSALLPLGWVECDACRVLTHVACARDVRQDAARVALDPAERQKREKTFSLRSIRKRLLSRRGVRFRLHRVRRNGAEVRVGGALPGPRDTAGYP